MTALTFKEKLRSGTLTYIELLNAAFECPKTKLKTRFESLTGNSENFFANNFHEQKFIEAISREDVRTFPKEFIGALYLLTADGNLWKQAREAVNYQKFKVNFNEIEIAEMSVNGYNFLKTAEDFLCGTHYLTFADISNMEIIDDSCFKIIVNAFALKKFGIYAIMCGKESKQSNEN